MSETPFFKTRMGHKFYEHTVPELVRQITRMNDLLERMLDRLDDPRRGDVEPADDDIEEPA